MPVRRFRFILLAGIATLALPAAGTRPAFVQEQAGQVVLTNARGFDFGRFVAGTGGTIVLGRDGLRWRTGGVILLNSPHVGQAVFNLGHAAGGGNMTGAIVTLPPDGAVRIASGANSMAVGSFVGPPDQAVAIPAGGATFSIGATLTVAPNQAPGTYSGTFPLTVNYE